MLSRQEIEERLKGDLTDIAENLSPLRIANCERQARETAQQLAELLGALAVFPDDEVAEIAGQGPWLYIDRSLWGDQATRYDAATKAALAWLEGSK